MASQSYMTRALKARDPRFARILGRLGYRHDEPKLARATVRPEGDENAGSSVEDDAAELRAEYERVVGKRPFLGWSAATLREKIDAAKADD